MFPIYANENVESAVIRGLQRYGWDVVRALDVLPEGSPDRAHLERATGLGRVLLTTDQDFLRLNAEYAAAGRAHAEIVFWKQRAWGVGEVVRRIVAYGAALRKGSPANTVKFL